MSNCDYSTLAMIKTVIYFTTRAILFWLKKMKMGLSPCLSPLDFWNIECHSISKYQVWKIKKSIWFRNWFLQATQAVKIKFELEKKSSWFWTRFFSEFEINSEIQNSKIECREIGRKIVENYFLFQIEIKKNCYWNCCPLFGPCTTD